jgi:hypothetical protein
MATPRRTGARRRGGELTMRELLELRRGPTPYNNNFPTDDDRRAAWYQHRARLMANDEAESWMIPPSRPWAWWKYDRDIDPPHRGDTRYAQMVLLAEMGELSPSEVAKVRRLAADGPSDARPAAVVACRFIDGDKPTSSEWAAFEETHYR